MLQNIAFLQQNYNLLKQDRDFLFSSFNEYKRDCQNIVAQVLTIQKRLDIFSENANVFSDKSENLEALVKFDEIFKKLTDFTEKIASLERENYGLKTEKTMRSMFSKGNGCKLPKQLTYLKENLAKMNKNIEECNEIIENLEKQNNELRSKREDPAKMDLLLKKVERKKLKIQTLKKKLSELDLQKEEGFSKKTKNIKEIPWKLNEFRRKSKQKHSND